MDSHTHSAQVGRLEVVDTGRRRRWSEDEKLKIVLESLQAPRQISATARRYGISRTQLLQWRRSFQGLLRLHSRYGPPDCSAAQSDLCHEAPAPPVTRPGRSSATRSIDNSLGGISLH
jgi:hypothetical protein